VLIRIYFGITSNLSTFASPTLFIPMTRLLPTTKILLVHVYQLKSIFAAASCWSKMEAVGFGYFKCFFECHELASSSINYKVQFKHA
jgi:hypothetical protein